MFTRQWQQDFIDCKEERSVWITPRQSGKTTAILLKCLEEPQTMVITPVRAMTELLINKYEHLHRFLHGGSDLPRPQIYPAGGLGVSLCSVDLNHVRQFLIDECDHIPYEDLEPIRPYFDQANVHMITTPHLARELSTGYRFAMDHGAIIHRVRPNEDVFTRDMVEEFRRCLSPDAFRSEILGLYPAEMEANLNRSNYIEEPWAPWRDQELRDLLGRLARQ